MLIPPLVLDLGELLKLSEQTSGRFIALGEGEFLALTQGFRARQQRGQQQSRQQEVAQVIGAELQLEALGGAPQRLSDPARAVNT